MSLAAAPDIDRARLAAWMATQVAGFAGPLCIESMHGGQSNPTYRLSTPRAEYVLRRKPVGQLLPGAHAVDREARVMRALAAIGFPVPRVHALCTDETVIGSWFYVMDLVAGRIFKDCTFPGVAAAQRAAYLDSLNGTIAALHSIDPYAVGLGDFGRPDQYLQRQIRRWSAQYAADRDGGRNADLDWLCAWLPAHIPGGDEVRVVHGDFKVDNVVYAADAPRIVAVLDWELSTLGHPLVDFAYHLLMYRLPSAIAGGLADRDLSALDLPCEADYVRRYCARTARTDIANLEFYLLFNLFRLAAILHGIRGRVARGTAAGTNALEAAGHLEFLAATARALASQLERSASLMANLDTAPAAKELGHFDPHARDVRVGAEQLWDLMRSGPALAHSDRHGGFYLVARFEDLKSVLLRPDIFSSADGITLPAAAVRSAHIPTELDPPLHGAFRAILTRFFTPQAVRAHEPAVRALAQRLLAGFRGLTHVDFVAVFARPFPVFASVQLMGLPLEDATLLDALVIELHEEVATGIKTGAAARLTDYVARTVSERRHSATDPDANLVTGIVHGRIGDRALTLDEQVSMVRLLLIGGFDSTAIALATAIWWLAQHAPAAQRLREAPELIDRATEEVVRYASPASYLRRTVKQATVLGATALQPGDQLLLSFGAANRDPRQFERAEELVMDRAPNPHLGFGAGVHRCLGSFFAKLEMRVMLEEFLGSYGSFRLDGARPIRMSSGLNQGIVSLPLILGEPTPV